MGAPSGVVGGGAAGPRERKVVGPSGGQGPGCGGGACPEPCGGPWRGHARRSGLLPACLAPQQLPQALGWESYSSAEGRPPGCTARGAYKSVLSSWGDAGGLSSAVCVMTRPGFAVLTACSSSRDCSLSSTEPRLHVHRTRGRWVGGEQGPRQGAAGTGKGGGQGEGGSDRRLAWAACARGTQ